MKLQLIIVLCAAMLLSACGRNPQPAANAGSSSPAGKAEVNKPISNPSQQLNINEPATGALTPPTLDDLGDTDELAIISTNKGDIVVEFFASLAPMHVANFKKLARAGFYDGTTFHRVLPGFVIQGGDPNSKDSDPANDGTGGPGWSVKAEFSSTPHEKGILSMARSQDINSAGSQFFICLGRAEHLDNKYTVFGRVIKGMDVVDEIGRMKRDPMSPHDRTLPATMMRTVKIVPKTADTGK